MTSPSGVRKEDVGAVAVMGVGIALFAFHALWLGGMAFQGFRDATTQRDIAVSMLMVVFAVGFLVPTSVCAYIGSRIVRDAIQAYRSREVIE